MSEHIPPIESERRIATVMFADISGFTAMSEKMDPEDVADVMKDCFSLMGACIEEYGGTIDKFIGDCVMVLFGAPQAQEDAPQRALNTALQIRTRLKDFNAERQLSCPLDIHIGINTGEVIAGLMGSDKRQDFTVMGDTVNLASRLEGAAETGSILISENTYRLTEGYFDFAYAGEVQVKGKEQPSRPGVCSAPGASSPASIPATPRGSRPSWAAAMSCGNCSAVSNRRGKAAARWWAWWASPTWASRA